jgi:hypothetical protein
VLSDRTAESLRPLLLDLLAALPDRQAAAARLERFAATAGADVWPALVEYAAAHGILGVLAPVLQQVALPDAVASHLERRRVIESLWHAQVRGAQADAIRTLAAGHIPVCALKGPALAARLYDDPSVRPSLDVDLLIRHDDLARAVEALLAAGYHAADDDVVRAYLIRHSHHLSFSRPNQPGLELHFHAYAGFGAVLSSGALMDRAQPFELDGVKPLVPSAEDELVYLAVHAAGHSFIRLLWLHDLKQLIARNPGLAWNAVAERARAWHVAAPVGEAVALLRTWLHVDVPDVARLTSPSIRRRAARLLLDRVSAPAERSASDNLGGLVYTALLCDRPASTLWLVSHHIGRALKRRAHSAAPRALPASWSG